MAEGSERNTELPQFSEFAPVAIGTGVWALLLVIGLVFRQPLVDHGHGWWIWTAVAGVVLGLFGNLYMHRRRTRLISPETPNLTQATPDQ